MCLGVDGCVLVMSRSVYQNEPRAADPTWIYIPRLRQVLPMTQLASPLRPAATRVATTGTAGGRNNVCACVHNFLDSPADFA